jgi:hypothetical protein
MSNNIRVLGSGEINGGDYCEINVQGSIKIKSDTTFQKMQVLGKLDCNHKLFGTEFCLTGSIKGNSNIKTTRTAVVFSSNSTCQTITSNIIKITPKKTLFKKGVFSCESMSGNEIFVSDVVAKSICGKDICVDGKSHIQELKYWGIYTISEQAIVDKIVKLENV